MEVSTGSSSGGGSSSAGSWSAEPTEGLTALVPVMEVGAPIGPEPSAVNPLPSLLGEDSSNAEAPVGKPAAVEAPAFDLEEDSGEAESTRRPPSMAEVAPSVDASARPLGLFMGTLCCF